MATYVIMQLEVTDTEKRWQLEAWRFRADELAVTSSTVWPDRKWEYSLLLREVNQEVPNYTQLDERGWWFYEAVGVTVGMMGRTIGGRPSQQNTPRQRVVHVLRPLRAGRNPCFDKSWQLNDMERMR
jgi:hypothetical protein